MTRNIPEPLPERPAHDGKKLVYAAVDEVLRRADLHQITGKVILTIDLNQGHPRAVRIGSADENFKI